MWRFSGKRLVEIRKTRGLTQAQLGKLMGIDHKQQIAAWEAGRHVPGGNTVGKMSAVLDVFPGYFFIWRRMEKKGFIECLSNFMGDSEGLTQEDMVAELEEQGVDVGQLKNDVAEIVKLARNNKEKMYKLRPIGTIFVGCFPPAISSTDIDFSNTSTALCKDEYTFEVVDHVKTARYLGDKEGPMAEKLKIINIKPL